MKETGKISKSITTILGGIVAIIVGITMWPFKDRPPTPILSEGEVVDKNHIPARTEYSYERSRSEGGNEKETQKPVHTPAYWRINVYGCDQNGNPMAEAWYVGEVLYAQIEIGDMVRRDYRSGIVKKV